MSRKPPRASTIFKLNELIIIGLLILLKVPNDEVWPIFIIATFVNFCFVLAAYLGSR